jgi:hypothetical protein
MEAAVSTASRFIAFTFSTLTAIAAPAQSTVLSFSDLVGAGEDAFGTTSPYQSAGYTLTSGSGLILYWGTGSEFYLGKPAIFGSEEFDRITLQRSDGGSFAFGGIEMAPFAPSLMTVPYTVDFVGKLVSGAFVTEQAAVNSATSFSSTSFSSFGSVSEVSWSTSLNQFSQVTNLLVAAGGAVSAVPEAGSLTYLLFGLTAIGAYSRSLSRLKQRS